MLNRLSVAIYALAIVTAIGLSRPDIMSANAAAPASNGVVKVKSLYGFDDTINRLKADIAQKGIMFFSAIDQAQACERCRHQASAIDTPDLWQSSPRYSISDIKPGRRARLAGPPAGDAGRGGSSLGSVYGFRLDCAPSPHQGPGRRVQNGVKSHRVDNIKRGLEIGRRHPFASNFMQRGKTRLRQEQIFDGNSLDGRRVQVHGAQRVRRKDRHYHRLDSGIGLGIARSLAAAGMNVVLNGFGTAADINKTRDDLAKIYDVSVTYSAADMSKPEQIVQMVEDASRIFGQVDILVNNAGILHAGPVEVTPPNTWDSIMAINLSAVFHAIRTVLPGMKAQGFGRIVNVSSALA